MAVSELLADRVRTLLTGEPGLSERKMFGGLCFMINGNMACGITGKNDLMLRVGPDAYEAALAHPDTRPMDFTGRPMKGMVFVDPDACPDAEDLAAWLERALSFARSLPAK
jgi:hypothetical protein